MTETVTRIAPREVLAFVHAKVGLGRQIALEGPPIYLWPVLPAQRANYPAFIRGWELVDALRSTIPDRAASQWNLLDDFNHRPQEACRPAPEQVIADILSYSPMLRALWSFRTIPQSYQGINFGFWESQFVTAGGDNTCRNLDAKFQTLKLAAMLNKQLAQRGVDFRQASRKEVEIKSFPPPLLLMVHPEEFRTQQAEMLPYMLGHMKHSLAEPSIYEKLSKTARCALLSQAFTHVWLDPTGEIVSVTSPRWNPARSVFEHQEARLCS